VRNNADNLVYTAEKTKKDLDKKLTEEQKAKIDGAVSALKDALAGTDTAKIKEKSEELTKTLQEVGSSVYQQAQAEYAQQKGQAGPGPAGSGGDKVVDSEDYKVK
jgi:molecular chaperone DnaK